MKRGNSKRALSPVVASVLLVALVLVLASIIFLWARGFIGEQIEKGDKSISAMCEEVSFSFDLIEDPRSISGKYQIELVNNGNIPIFKFTIVKKLAGSEERFNFDITVKPQKAIRRDLDLLIDGSPPEQITVYPVLLGEVIGQNSNMPYTCNDQGKVEPL
jgi:flagellin-like protein